MARIRLTTLILAIFLLGLTGPGCDSGSDGGPGVDGVEPGEDIAGGGMDTAGGGMDTLLPGDDVPFVPGEDTLAPPPEDTVAPPPEDTIGPPPRTPSTRAAAATAPRAVPTRSAVSWRAR